MNLSTHLGANLWGPLKELWETVEGTILRRQPETVHLLDLQLKKHKPHFLSLFKNPVRKLPNMPTSIITLFYLLFVQWKVWRNMWVFVPFSAQKCRAERKSAQSQHRRHRHPRSAGFPTPSRAASDRGLHPQWSVWHWRAGSAGASLGR